MTDYQEEQKNELEALESIYPDEFTLITLEPYPSFKMRIRSENYHVDAENGVCCNIIFTYVEKYPDVVPVTEIKDVENLNECDILELEELLRLEAQENLGMVMVFTLITAVQEHLNKKVDEMKKRKEEEKENLLREKEELESKQLIGTRVTVESFLAWKANFDAEMADLKKQNLKTDIVKKLTGRELFEKDATLNDSDMSFLQEAGGDVVVDESLFQDLDDLELEEDLEDDDD